VFCCRGMEVGGEGGQLVEAHHADVGGVLEEDQPQDDVLVLGGVHLAAELVRRVPERGSRLLVARAGFFGLGRSSSEAAGGFGTSGVLATSSLRRMEPPRPRPSAISPVATSSVFCAPKRWTLFQPSSERARWFPMVLRPLGDVTRRIRDRLRRQERASEWPLMPTVRWQDKAQVLSLRRSRWQDKAQVLSLRRSRWQDKAQVVSLRRSRLEHAAVEVAVVFRTPDGRYIHRRMRCSGSDLKSGLGHLFDPNPETLAYAGEPSFPRAVEDHSFESADQALDAALAQDPPAHPGQVEIAIVGQVGKVEIAIVVLGVLRRGTRDQGRAGGRAHRDTREAGRRCGISRSPCAAAVRRLVPTGLARHRGRCGGGLGHRPVRLRLYPGDLRAHFIADAFRRRNLAREKNK
jgi:hypothetical protein